MSAQTVLIIDDDATFREKLCSVVRDAGYEVVEAFDGSSALSVIEQLGEHIDFIVVDLCLPDNALTNATGLDIIQEARRKIPAKIIAATAVVEQVYLDIAAHLGADLALRKPLDGDVTAMWLGISRHLGNPASPPSQRLIVLADDDGDIRRITKTVLQRAGYQVLEATDGTAALALIDKIGGALDLLVTDYEMPNLNGTDLVRAMRAKYPSVPVLYISGYVADSTGQRFADPENACAFLPKPFRPKQLIESIKCIISKTKTAPE